MPVTIDGTNGITTPSYGGADTSEYLVPVTQFKNRIINGAMVIDQRNAGASATANDGTFFTDRFVFADSVDAKFTGQQSSTAPAGFKNSLLLTSSSAYSVSSTDYFLLNQNIEGFNVADLGWGTADAKTVTLSFWVRSSLTGTFGGVLNNSANDRSYAYTYTISAANTWEYKTVTIAGDTSGTWVTNNGLGLRVRWALGAGSTRSTSAGSWQAGLYLSATGAVSVVGTNGATFYITGVQLEVGSTATSFDYRPYGTELALCQRYYSTSFPTGTAPAQNSGIYTWRQTTVASGYGSFAQIYYPVPMRITGTTITGYNGGAANNLVRSWPGGQDFPNLSFIQQTNTGFTLQYYGGGADGTGNPVGWNWAASAEL
jgi:hypothetical protein